MDINDAIISSIIEGNHRYGTIFTRTNKITHLSKETFNNHLKQLVVDEYITKTDKGKQKIEYKINQEKIDEVLEFKEDEELNDLIKNNDKVLKFKGKIFLRVEAKHHLEELMQKLDQHVDFCLQEQRRMMIMMNLRKFNLTLQKKFREEFKKYEISFKQTLEIMEKLSPEIRDDYEQFLLLKTFNWNKLRITKIKKFTTTSLLKKYVKNYKNLV